MDYQNRLYLLILVLLPVALYFSFSSGEIADTGYTELIKLKSLLGNQSVDLVKILIILSTIVSTILIFYGMNLKDINSFFVALLFLLSPAISINLIHGYSFTTALSVLFVSIAFYLFFSYKKPVKYLALFPFIIAVFITYSFQGFSFSFQNISDIGLVFPISTLPLLFMYKGKIDETVFIFIIGIVSAFFSLPIAIISLSFSALKSTEYFFKNFDDKKVWLILTFFIGFYILFDPITLNITHNLSAALAISVIAYFLLSLFDLSHKKYVTFFMIFMFSLGFTNLYLAIQNSSLDIPNSEDVNSFKFVASLQGSTGILAYPHAFEYYTDKKPVMLDSKQLLSNKELDLEYIALSSDKLFDVLSSSSITFRLVSLERFNDGNYIAQFLSGDTLLRLQLSSDFEIMGDGVLIDLTTNSQGRTVSFPKLKLFNQNESIISANNVIINTENIIDSNVYNLLFRKQSIYSGVSTKLIKVK